MVGNYNSMTITAPIMDWGYTTTSSSVTNYTTHTINLRVAPSGYPTVGSGGVVEAGFPNLIPAGKRELGLPDGSKLVVDDLGNYRIEDKDAKVTYQANRVRPFSPHLNASDLLAQFVRYAGSLGVRQREVLQLPIELFINWLVIEAAERDQDPIPEDIKPLAQQLSPLRKPRCLVCKRFIPLLHHRNRFPFCDPAHAERHVKRLALTQEAQ